MVSFTRDSREMGVELTHAVVKRVSGTVKAENQGALVPLRTIGFRFPFAQMLVGGVAREARLPRAWTAGIFLGADHWRWVGESGDGHVWGEEGENYTEAYKPLGE